MGRDTEGPRPWAWASRAVPRRAPAPRVTVRPTARLVEPRRSSLRLYRNHAGEWHICRTRFEEGIEPSTVSSESVMSVSRWYFWGPIVASTVAIALILVPRSDTPQPTELPPSTASSGPEPEGPLPREARSSQDQSLPTDFNWDNVDLMDVDSDAWVEIRGGTLMMGASAWADERPVHAVTLSTFRISRFPITNEQYKAYVDDDPEAQAPSHWEGGEIPAGYERHPVVFVSWYEAVAYTRWLTRQAGFSITLPTEAEWEFAARGTARREYPWGNEEPTTERTNFFGNVGTTTPVDAYPEGATTDGVYDMAGNAEEWVQDCWHRNYEGAPADGSAWTEDDCQSSLVRGGANDDLASQLRAAYRYRFPYYYRSNEIGFRVVWRPTQADIPTQAAIDLERLGERFTEFLDHVVDTGPGAAFGWHRIPRDLRAEGTPGNSPDRRGRVSSSRLGAAGAGNEPERIARLTLHNAR